MKKLWISIYELFARSGHVCNIVRAIHMQVNNFSNFMLTVERVWTILFLINEFQLLENYNKPVKFTLPSLHLPRQCSYNIMYLVFWVNHETFRVVSDSAILYDAATFSLKALNAYFGKYRHVKRRACRYLVDEVLTTVYQ